MRRFTFRGSVLRRGFTFIEIMLVVLIIGILMAAVVPNMVGRVKSARINVAKQSLNAIETMLQSFEMRADRFPSSDEGLKALKVRPADLGEDQWDGPYSKGDDDLKDPWGQDFVFRSPGTDNADFDLFSKGPDKQEGTKDDVYKKDKKAATQ